jgi:hypothetical protein
MKPHPLAGKRQKADSRHHEALSRAAQSALDQTAHNTAKPPAVTPKVKGKAK